MKTNQNSKGIYRNYKWFSTNNSVIVLTDTGIKTAAVKRTEDFDFEALFQIAIANNKSLF